jgi:protease IV
MNTHLTANTSDPLKIYDWIYKPNLPIDSVASADDITGLIFNPAGLGFHPLQFAYFYGQNESETIDNHSLFINLLGFAFSAQARSGFDSSYANRFSIGSSLFHSEELSLGTSYTWIDSNYTDIDEYRQLDLGLMIRPHRRISIGLVGRSLNQPKVANENLKPRLDFGLSIRPLPTAIEDFTISVDSSWSRINNLEEISPRFHLEYQNLYGLTGYGGYELDGNVFFGIKFSQEASQIIGQYSKNQNNEQNFSGGILLTGERFGAKSSVLKRVLIIDLNQPFVEIKQKGTLFSNENRTHSEIIDSIFRASKDERIAAIILKGSQYKGGWAQAEELRHELENFSQAKPVYAYLESVSNKEYYISSVAKEISMPISGSIDIAGFKLDAYFLKDLLAKVGVEADFIAIGKYKSAPEMFTKTEMSPANKDQLSQILKSLNTHFTNSILASRRDLDKESFESARSQGLFTASKGLKEKLIDHTEYYYEFLSRLRKSGLPDISSWSYSLSDYLATEDYKDYWSSPATIAVVHLDGDIVSGPSSRPGFFSSFSIGSESTIELLEVLEKDNNIKAVVLRINSPGGSALASDLIWASVKKLSTKKKVIVSMGNSAASGGYYISMGGSKVFANYSTITGSIGIFSGKFSVKSLYELIGINKQTLKTHPNAAIFSESDKFTPEERELLKENIASFYELFLNRVADNRQMKAEQVNKVAQGRVYTGFDAKQVNLVDNIGGVRTAILSAIEYADVDPSFYRIRHYPKGENDFLSLSQGSLVAFPDLIRNIFKQIKRTEELKNENIYFLMPYQIDIE